MKKKKQRDVFYYKIIDYHKEMTGYNTPLNTVQLYYIVGTEECKGNFVNPKSTTPKKFITHICLADIEKMDHPATHLSTAMLAHYPWDKLTASIAKLGMRIPVLLEKRIINGKPWHHYIEGNHRLTSATRIKPYNPNLQVPCVFVTKDVEYTSYMKGKEHPKI